MSHNMGINTILETGKNKSITTFKIIAKSKIINNIEFNLNLLKLSIKEDENILNLILLVKDNERYNFILDKRTKQVSKIINNKQISFDTFIKNNKDETYLAIAMVLLDNIKNVEIKDGQKNLLSKSSTSNNKSLYSGNKLAVAEEEEGGCERTIMSIRTTESRAISHVNSATATYIEDHPDCKKVYGVDSGCLWGGYGCIATQSIKCTGSGCDIIIGSPEE